MRIDEIGRQPCSIAKALAEIGDAWSMLIIREAFYGRARFSELVEHTGAQKTVVSARLKSLVEVGILDRQVYSEHPTRYHYVLTDKGRSLAPVLLTLIKWGDTWLDTEHGQRVILTHTCGHHVDATVVCGACGEPVQRGSVTPRPGPGQLAVAEAGPGAPPTGEHA
ncbi:MAG: helix-turn-helix domain-containing protein [Actinomycetota bacterium]